MANKTASKKNNSNTTKLSEKQKAFCRYYMEFNNATEAAKKAGYSEKTAVHQGSRLLTKIHIQEEIARLREPLEKESIMTAQEVMQHFTAIARGEEKDQFGIEISASDRIKALVELAKRTVDIDNRAAGKADANVEIKLDWSR